MGINHGLDLPASSLARVHRGDVSCPRQCLLKLGGDAKKGRLIAHPGGKLHAYWESCISPAQGQAQRGGASDVEQRSERAVVEDLPRPALSIEGRIIGVEEPEWLGWEIHCGVTRRSCWVKKSPSSRETRLNVAPAAAISNAVTRLPCSVQA